MKTVFFAAVLLIFTASKPSAHMFTRSNTTYSDSSYNLLALGDSYTIGEAIPSFENFPHQLVQQLRGQGIAFHPAEIIARTGWTTDELEAGIRNTTHLGTYDFVTLLIGVNNQYRGRSAQEYAVQFEGLLKQSIDFAAGKKEHVIVLSIPDWGVTPFAADRDRDAIAREIDAFNAINRKISQQYQVHYLDITGWTREAGKDPGLVAGDGLHPSAREYARWAMGVADLIRVQLADEQR